TSKNVLINLAHFSFLLPTLQLFSIFYTIIMDLLNKKWEFLSFVLIQYRGFQVTVGLVGVGDQST
ncbi:hypothetical protein, partial [Candidatus Electrothrix sp.]|uniref:hypothetical protein n=2 Tax=Candidatus Electrothrix sp. TaxID=2170559 RepID=UPI004055B79C